MSLLVSHNKHDPSLELVVDIGTGSIGAAYVYIKGDEAPRVIASVREIIPFQEKLDVMRFISLMCNTLEHALLGLDEKSPGSLPGGCSVTLASPWYLAQTRLVHVAQPDEFVVNEHALTQLINQEVSLFLNSDPRATKTSEVDQHTLIDARAISLRLNGYNVKNVIGRSVRELDMALYCSMMPTPLHDGLHVVVQKKFGPIPMQFHAFMFAVYNSIRDCFNEEMSYIVVDIAGEATDVALVRDDALLETFSFPVGHRAILRTIMRGLSIEAAAASSSLELYLSGESSEEHASAIEPLIDKAMRDWQRLFRGSLAQITEQYPIPREMYVIADEQYNQYYEKELFEAGDEILKDTGERFRIHALGRDLLDHFVEFPDGVAWDGLLCVIIMMIAKLRALKQNIAYEYETAN